jgi:hypothetical protein
MLYHKEVGFPKEVEAFFGNSFQLALSNHAYRACHSDCYGDITPPTTVTITPENLFEVETTGNIVTKLAIRQPYNKEIDISIVLITKQPISFVKTIWLNKASDKHYTLDKSKYTVPM